MGQGYFAAICRMEETTLALKSPPSPVCISALATAMLIRLSSVVLLPGANSEKSFVLML